MYVVDTGLREVYGPFDSPGLTILVEHTNITDVSQFSVWDAVTNNMVSSFSILGSYVIEPVITPQEIDTVFEDYQFVGWAWLDDL